MDEEGFKFASFEDVDEDVFVNDEGDEVALVMDEEDDNNDDPCNEAEAEDDRMDVADVDGTEVDEEEDEDVEFECLRLESAGLEMNTFLRS